jgi:high-affinity nickel-transport protein
MTMTDALPTIGLALLLGLRHGLAPDHLAAIDGLTLRATARAAPWMGALFSLGHGIIMLSVVAMAATAVDRWLAPGPALRAVLDIVTWLPGVFLLVLALWNARALLRRPARASGTPLPMQGRAGPIGALVVGMVFALGAESALQALAWGSAAASLGGVGAALQVAAAFIAGMTITDALDGATTARIARRAGQQAMLAFRRRLGWPVVGLCTVSGLQLITAKACAACAPEEHWLTMLGVGMVTLTFTVYLAGVAKLLRPDRSARA